MSIGSELVALPPFVEEFCRDLFDMLSDGVYFVTPTRQITFWNAAAERITGYKREEVLGSACSDGILNHVDDSGTNLCLAGCPLAATMLDGKGREAKVFLRHKSGHRIPVLIRSAPIRDVNRNIVGAVEVFTDRSGPREALRRMEELEQLAFLDPLTGTGNRRFAEHVMTQRLSELRRNGWRFGLCFFDIDHFKEVNDRFGHEAGDAILKTVARSVLGAVRTYDFVARWGGEEFLVVAPQKNGADLEITAERLRNIVAASAAQVGLDAIRVTISIGATIARPGDSAESLVARADSLMYLSKSRGRNRVTLDGAEPRAETGAETGAEPPVDPAGR
jgi:diguanylate cyclase (GGDEF)-like protein/PAS domain S-box-containing protein